MRNLGSDEGVSFDDVRQGVIGTVVGCRMHSTRLPRKALLEINGVTSIERCLLNAMASKRSQKTILATSIHSDDAILENYTLNGNALFFRGAETDLAGRYLDVGQKFGLDVIIRVPGDRLLISPELMDYLIDEHLRVGADFSFFKNTPLGVNPEVINYSALKRLKKLISTDKYSEYLTLFFKNNSDYFELNEVEPLVEFRHPEYRLVLDYPEDFETLRTIFFKLDVKKEPLSLRRVLDLLKKEPEIAKINASIKPKYIDGDFAKFLNRVTTIKKRIEKKK